MQPICTNLKMPKTKAYSERRKVLNELFRSRYYTLEELIDKVNERIGTNVSKKTIQDMIRYMRAEGAPIINEPNRGYIYEPKTYNIEETKIAAASVERIKLAATMLKQIPGLDIHEELNEVFEKLDMRIYDDENFEETFIQFDTRPGYVGAVYLADILEAIKGKTVISFDYQPFKYDTPMQMIIHPYLLKEYNNRWFLIGLPEHLRQKKQYEFYQYGLERIKSKIKPVSKIEHYIHHSFDPLTFCRDIIGVSTPRNAKNENVILRFSPDRAKYISTNPWHHSQTKIEGEENAFQFNLISNVELESIILSYGSDVEVLKPSSLRKKIKSLLIEAAKKYT